MEKVDRWKRPETIGSPARVRGHFTHVDLHVLVEAIVLDEVVSHPYPVWLHGMPLAIVVVSNLSCREHGTSASRRYCSDHTDREHRTAVYTRDSLWKQTLARMNRSATERGNRAGEGEH